MAARTSWEGYLKLNLISVPVKAYNAASSGGGEPGFHLIHETCHNRIRYQKVCPVHGDVPNDEVVSAYEVSKGQFVPVGKNERDKLRPEDDKALTIDTFVRPDALDPIYYGDRSYYLVPDGKVAQKPYAVLQEVMAERQRYALVRIVLSGREHVGLLRPVDGLLIMTLLNYDDEVKKPSEFEDDRPDVAIAAKERELARQLVDASTAERFDFAGYKDEYAERLAKMLQSKSGKAAAPTGGHDEPVVVNLMDALRQSLARQKGGAAEKPARRAKTKPAKGRAARASNAAKSRRKTG